MPSDHLKPQSLSGSAPLAPSAPPAYLARVNVALAAAILSAWLAVHIFGVFFYQWGAHALISAPLLIGLACWLSVGLFIVAHDCMHGSLVPGHPAVNRWIGQLCLGLYAGFSFAALCEKHHQHHRHPGTGDDPDFYPPLGATTNERTETNATDARSNSLNATCPGANDPDANYLRTDAFGDQQSAAIGRSPDHGPLRTIVGWYGRFLTTYFTWWQFAFMATVSSVYLIILKAGLANVLLLWALPAVLSSFQLFYFGTYLPHRPAAAPFSDRHRARNNAYGWWLSLLTCFHFGYHHVHHVRPSVPWWRLPRAHAALAAEAHAALTAEAQQTSY